MILDIWTKYGKSVILPAIVCAGIIIYFLLAKEPQSPEPILLSAAPEQAEQLTEQPQDAPEHDVQSIVVDVKGAVNHPGVYPFTTDDRIIDAINAAGGYVKEADTRAINHAQKLTDELVIYVPKKGEQLDDIAVEPSSPVTASSGSSSSKSDTVNINSATESELTTLPGIGPSKAAAIIAYREEHGPFKAPEELTNVSGIGQKTFERLQSFIAVK